MKVVVRINHESFEYEINKYKKTKLVEEYDSNKSYSNLDFDSHSDYLYHKIYEELGLEKGKYFLKYKNFELCNDENLSKILNEDELCYLDVEWNDFLDKITKIEINNKIYIVPSEVINDSTLLKNNSKDEEVIVFKNNILKKNFLVNDWIRISNKLRKFLSNNNMKDLSIPNPIVQGAFLGDRSDILANYVGRDLSIYLNSLDLDRLRDLAKSFEYLEASNLLEVVCASIATRIIYSKNLDDVKSLGII